MTPTEQDKELRERVEAIFKNPHCQSCHEDWDYDPSYRTDSCCTRFMTDSISKVVQLITADRKRVALEARIDELNNLRDMDLSVVTHNRIIDRIAELKAHQEKSMSNNDTDRLLSDEELLEAIDNTLKHIDAGDFALAGQDPKIAFLNLINTQKRLYADSERYNWVIKGAETVVEDLSDWIKENNPTVSDIQHRISTITGSIELKKLDKEVKDKLRAEQRARIK